MSWIVKGSPLINKADQPKSFFLTEFTPETVRAFQNTVTTAINIGQPFLPIYIESPGGSAYAMCAILSCMENGRGMGLKFATIVNGTAQSAGAITFAYGDPELRFMSPFSTLMFHNLSMGAIGKVGEGLQLHINAQNLENRVFEKISKHLKKPKDWLKKTLEKKKNYDWELSAEEAVNEGIASIVHSPQFTVGFEEQYRII